MESKSYQNDLKKFWENRNRAREKRDEEMARLPFSEKIAIIENLQRDGKLIQAARDQIIGLRITNSDVVNELRVNESFSTSAFEQDFPFTEQLRSPQ